MKTLKAIVFDTFAPKPNSKDELMKWARNEYKKDAIFAQTMVREHGYNAPNMIQQNFK